MKPIALHLVARCQPFKAPLSDPRLAGELWRRLRMRFPHVYAAVLMPNHLHLILPFHSKLRCNWNLGIELRAWTQRHFAGSSMWTPSPEPVQIPDHKHLLRQIRYVHLNPCRSHLIKDPLEWEWSTHRDLTDCTIDPWVTPLSIEPLLSASGLKRRGSFADTFHHYVSADPSVNPIGTPSPQSPQSTGSLHVGSRHILDATVSVLRRYPLYRRNEARTLAIQTARHLGWKQKGKEFELTQRQVSRINQTQPDKRTLQMVLLHLGDLRLRRCTPPGPNPT